MNEKHENECSEYDDASIPSCHSDDSSTENEDSGWGDAILSTDTPDEAIMKLIDVARNAYAKRDGILMFSNAYHYERIKGVTRLDVLNKQNEFQLALSKYIEFYVDFERFFIHKALISDDVITEAEQLLRAFKPNDIIGFQTHLNDYLLGKLGGNFDLTHTNTVG